MSRPCAAGSTTTTWVAGLSGAFRLALPSRNLLKQFRQSSGVLHGLAEAGGFVRPRESGDLTLQNRLLDGGHKIVRRLRWSLTPAAPCQPAQHPVVPERGGFARCAVRVSPQPAIRDRAQNVAEIDQDDERKSTRLN